MSIIKGTNQIVAGFGGTKRSIGEVYFSQSSLATDNSGALPLFTGETIASANTIYPEFYNWVLAHTELQCTSEEYESALTTYGECAKYVIGKIGDNATAPDYGTTTITAGSIRLPLIKNYIKAANPSEGIQNIEAGLPNITGTAKIGGYGSQPIAIPETSGALGTYENGSIMTRGESGQTNNWGLSIDASRSSSVYGKSSTVTPASTTLYPWVAAYNAAVPASTAQAAEFQQELSGKVSKTGDTMTGPLKMSGQNQIKFGTDDNFYYVKKHTNGDLLIYNKDGKGLFLYSVNNKFAPYYFDGTKGYRLLTTADLSNIDYVVESYHDADGNWYRKYKSGWLEQGGVAYHSSGDAVVTLLKPYADTGFAVMTTNEQMSNINAYGWTYIASKTTTGFTVRSRRGNGDAVTCNAMWEAKGQGAN